MPRLSRVLWLACLTSFWSCGKQEATPTAQQPAENSPAVAATEPTAAAQPATQPAVDAARKPTQVTSEQAAQIADRLIAAGNYRQALPILTQILKANPKSADTYAKRAAILAESRLLTQAVADMTRAIEIDSKNPKYLNTRGYFYLSQQNSEKALQDFNDAIGLDLNFPEPHNNRGLVRIAMGDPKTAVKDFDAAIQLKPEYLDAYNNRGYALMRLDQHEEAIATFTKAIELNPKYVNAWNNRGQARLKANQAEEALTDFSEAIRLAPTSTAYYIGRSDAYKALGRDVEAKSDRDRVEWLQTFTALTQQAVKNPKQAANWVARGRHLLKANEAQSAAADFNRALEIASDNADARCGRAKALIYLERLDEAIADCNIVLQKDAHPMAASLRGDAYYLKGELDKALEDYGTAKRLDGHVARTFLKRSELRRAAGDNANADADLEQAVLLDPSLGTVKQVAGEQPQAN